MVQKVQVVRILHSLVTSLAVLIPAARQKFATVEVCVINIIKCNSKYLDIITKSRKINLVVCLKWQKCL